MKRFLWAFALLAVIGPARAADALTPAAFTGIWSGGGVAENRDSIYFAMTARDIDVTIRPAGNGFTVTWTTVIRQGGNPQQPNVRRRETVKTFLPASVITGTAAGVGRIWRCADSGDPLQGKEACWARIAGNTLTIYLMSVLASGAYEIEQYDRTLKDTGMDLKYTRLRDRDPVRTVTGKLVKTGP